MSFDQAKYWLDRHQKLRGDPRSVGTLARSIDENLDGERSLQEVVRQAAALLKPASNVLDLGCGYGRVAGSFLSQGYDYTGYDISPEAIAEAKRRHPSGHFESRDLLGWLPNRQYDIVSVLYVFVHFVDDFTWETFLRKALDSVRPQGGFMFADEFPETRVAYGEHVVCRPISAYKQVFKSAGFALDEHFPMKLAKHAGGHACAKHFRLAAREKAHDDRR